jgi:hypothetical protein
MSGWIARLGQNMQFVAFVGHACFAALVVEHSGRFLWYAVAFFTIGGAVKEIWDIHYEHDPPQTVLDSLEDFLGWALGALIGVMLK